MARHCSRIAERVGLGVAPLKTDLVNTIIIRLNEESIVEADAALRVDIELRHPTANTRGIELLIPGGVQRVGEVDPFSVPAHLDHLRSAARV